MKKQFTAYGITMKCLKNADSDETKTITFTQPELVAYVRNQIGYYKSMQEDCLRAFVWAMYVLTKQVVLSFSRNCA